MEIANPNGELSMMTFVTGGKGYVQIYSGLSVSDATRFRKDIIVLHDMGIVEVEIYINSPGGDAFTGLAVADEIERAKLKGMKITAVASGIVASAAVPVFAACERQASGLSRHDIYGARVCFMEMAGT
jgi:ATP-dependent protease ClpP protease subunit